MKNICMAALIAAIPFSSAALAADLPVSTIPTIPTTTSNGWYAEATAGVGFGDVTLETSGIDDSEDDTGFAGRLGFGKILSDNIRVGVEGAFAAYSKSVHGEFADGGITVNGNLDVDVNVWSVMAVAYYDFRNDTRFTPYIGAGAGIGIMDDNADINIDGDPLRIDGSDSETSTHVAMKLAAGVAFDVTENMQVVTDYNFTYLHDADFADLVDASSTQSTINLGLRYSF